MKSKYYIKPINGLWHLMHQDAGLREILPNYQQCRIRLKTWRVYEERALTYDRTALINWWTDRVGTTTR